MLQRELLYLMLNPSLPGIRALLVNVNRSGNEMGKGASEEEE
jgi:hypothetical protein